MKTKVSFSILCCFFLLSCFSQENIMFKKEKSFNSYFDSQLFFRNYEDDKSVVITANIEYLIRRKNHVATAFSFGYGRIIDRNDYTQKIYSDHVVSMEVSKIFGISRHFFEPGFGFTYAHGYIMSKLRIGYRINLNQNMFFRIAYSPYIWLRNYYDENDNKSFGKGFHDLSVSFGYRFNLFQCK